MQKRAQSAGKSGPMWSFAGDAITAPALQHVAYDNGVDRAADSTSGARCIDDHAAALVRIYSSAYQVPSRAPESDRCVALKANWSDLLGHSYICHDCMPCKRATAFSLRAYGYSVHLEGEVTDAVSVPIEKHSNVKSLMDLLQ